MTLTTTTREAFNRRVLLRMLRLARDRVRPLVPSRTLRRDMQLFVDRSERGILQFPYYWAVYVHDGRGPFGVHSRARRGRRKPSVIVWFKNPKDDPRTNGGRDYPRRERQVRQLTRAQYEEGLKRNRQRSKGNPFMVVVKRVNSSRPGVPFIDRGLRGFDRFAGRIAQEEFSRLVNAEIFSDEDSVSIRL